MPIPATAGLFLPCRQHWAGREEDKTELCLESLSKSCSRPVQGPVQGPVQAIFRGRLVARKSKEAMAARTAPGSRGECAVLFCVAWERSAKYCRTPSRGLRSSPPAIVAAGLEIGGQSRLTSGASRQAAGP